jgi:hypothetical protein
VSLREKDAVHTCRFSGTQDGAQVVRILDPVQDDEERRLSALPRMNQDVLGLGIPLGRDQTDDALMPAIRHKPIQRSRWLNVHRDSRGSSKSHKFSSLPIPPCHQQSNQRSGTGSQSLPDGMHSVEQVGSVIASSGWSHRADPR